MLSSKGVLLFSSVQNRSFRCRSGDEAPRSPPSFPPILSENLVRRRTRSDRDVDEGAGVTVWSLSEVELWGKLGPRCNHMTFFKSGLSVNYKIADSGAHSIHPEISCL